MYWISYNLFYYLISKGVLNIDVNLIFKNNFFASKDKIINYTKNSIIKKQNYFALKYLSNFGSLVIVKFVNISSLNLNYCGQHKTSKFYFINSSNIYNYKALINIIFELVQEKKNFLILDNNYKSSFPLLNYIFSIKSINNYKSYFFLNIKHFSLKNWLYFYKSFLNKFNVNLLFILNLDYYYNFLSFLKNVNLPMSSLFPAERINKFIDYPIYSDSNFKNINKIIFLNLISQIYFISSNFLMLKKKLNFLKLFYKFSQIK